MVAAEMASLGLFIAEVEQLSRYGRTDGAEEPSSRCIDRLSDLFRVPNWFMKNRSHEPRIIRVDPLAADATVQRPSDSKTDPIEAAIALIRGNPEALADLVSRSRGGGERMARFLEVLADTGLVSEACRSADMSRESAYALRTRDVVFAAAWCAAQVKARPLVADGIVERSITGTMEHYYRDGVLVGERRHYESWLALAVLKRLDKQAEEDRADANLSARMASRWQETLEAVRNGGTVAVTELLGLETDKAYTPPSPHLPGCDPADDVWKNDDGDWMTIFPPPSDFDGHERGPWDGDSYYERACTAEEVELLEAHQAGMLAEERAELTAHAEARRDSWFAKLRNELNGVRQPGLDPGQTAAPPSAPDDG